MCVRVCPQSLRFDLPRFFLKYCINEQWSKEDLDAARLRFVEKIVELAPKLGYQRYSKEPLHNFVCSTLGQMMKDIHAIDKEAVKKWVFHSDNVVHNFVVSQASITLGPETLIDMANKAEEDCAFLIAGRYYASAFFAMRWLAKKQEVAIVSDCVLFASLGLNLTAPDTNKAW